MQGRVYKGNSVLHNMLFELRSQFNSESQFGIPIGPFNFIIDMLGS